MFPRIPKIFLISGLISAALAIVPGFALAQELAGGESAETIRLPAPEELPPPEAVAEASPSDQPQFQGEMFAEPEAWTMWSPAFLDPWEGNVELGLNGTDGNTNTFNIRLGALAKRKSEFRSEQLQITSIQKRANGLTTANTALADGRIDWPMPSSRFNTFIHSLIEYDQFKGFDYRISGDAGVGYEFLQSEITTLIGRVGASASREIGGPSNATSPEILLGGEYKHKFNATHQISAEMSFYPNVTDFADYRLNSQASWQIVLSQVHNLSLKLSLIDRYDSTPQGAKPNDLDYSTLLLWTF
jgi:putative salt-induced outer membrane protein YdiY